MNFLGYTHTNCSRILEKLNSFENTNENKEQFNAKLLEFKQDILLKMEELIEFKWENIQSHDNTQKNALAKVNEILELTLTIIQNSSK